MREEGREGVSEGGRDGVVIYFLVRFTQSTTGLEKIRGRSAS